MERSIKYLEAEKQSLLSKRQPQIDLLKERVCNLNNDGNWITNDGFG